MIRIKMIYIINTQGSGLKVQGSEHGAGNAGPGGDKNMKNINQ
jgi:hypothetical protein